MTKKEKIITKILYEDFKKTGSRSTTHSVLVNKSKGSLSGPELAQLIDCGRSIYFTPRGNTNTIVEITYEGIEYMENEKSRIVKEWAFWIIFIFSALAGIFSILDYFK